MATAKKKPVAKKATATKKPTAKKQLTQSGAWCHDFHSPLAQFR